MPWFKVDDNLAFHGKTVAAGNAALGLWVRAGSWSAQTLTEGFVPEHMIAAFGGTKSAGSLLSCGLWDRVDGGYQFHDWHEYQPSRESVENERRAAKDRQQRARDKARQAKEATQSHRDDHDSSRVSNGVSHGVTQALVTVPPTRPDPTRPNKESAPRKRGATGTRITEDWLPSAKVRDAMKLERPDLDFRMEHQNFIDHFLAASGQVATKVDWNAAWRKWMRSARVVERSHQTQRSGTSERVHFTPPAPPFDMPPRLERAWNLACHRANREGREMPDWHDLDEAS